jgi:hypothetical protein
MDKNCTLHEEVKNYISLEEVKNFTSGRIQLGEVCDEIMYNKGYATIES